MSKVKIQGNSSGTGIFTIEAPNSNTDRTLTLPDNAGEVLTNASSLSAANLTGSLPAIDGSALTNMPAGGKLVQYKYYMDPSIDDRTTSTAYQQAGGMSITFTPTSTSNYIILRVTGTFFIEQGWGGVNVRFFDTTNNAAIGWVSQAFRLDMQANRTQYMYTRQNGTVTNLVGSWTGAKTIIVQYGEANGAGQSAGWNGGPALFEILEIAP